MIALVAGIAIGLIATALSELASRRRRARRKIAEAERMLRAFREVYPEFDRYAAFLGNCPGIRRGDRP